MRKLILTVVLFLMLQIETAAQTQIYLPIVFKDKCMTTQISPIVADNKWRLVVPVASTNYVLNPSAETTGNFADIGGATTSRSTTYQKFGLYSYFADVAAANDGTRLTLTALTNTEHYVTVRVRKPIPTLYATLNTTTKELKLIEKIDKNWDLYGIGFSASEANAATALDITVGSAVDFYFDGVQVEPLAYWTTYIDGTQEGCEWNGAKNASTSTRSALSRAGGQPKDFYNEYGFMIQRIVGASATGISLNTDSYAILPGGELNSEKVESRDWTIVGKFLADSEAELHDNIEALQLELSNEKYPNLQQAKIRFNGSYVQKEIGANYRGGLEGNLPAYYDCYEVDDNNWKQVFKWQTDASIQLFSPDPFWYELGNGAVQLDTEDSDTFRVVASRFTSDAQWDSMGPPDAAGGYGNVRDIAEDGTYVYFGGNFVNFDNIAAADRIVRYNKNTRVWSAMGSGADDFVYGLTLRADGNLIVTGRFITIGGVAAARLALWDVSSETYSDIITNNPNDTVRKGAINPRDGNLYIVGEFTTIGVDSTPYAAVYDWNADTYSALGTGLNGDVYDLAFNRDGTKLYVVGNFTTAGGSSANYVAVWDTVNESWSTLSTGFDTIAYSVAVDDNDDVLFGGAFTTAGSISAGYIVKWNGTAFVNIGDADDVVRDINIGPDGIVYAGGVFDTIAGFSTPNGLARYNGATWANVDLALPGANTTFKIVPSVVSDPIVTENYNLFLGFDTTGTGTYGGLVTATNNGVVTSPQIYFNRSGGDSATIKTLRNEKTGKELLFNYGLLDGETITINSASSSQAVVSNYLGRKLDAILPNSDLGTFTLSPGDNKITSFVVNDGATITAWMQWRTAYASY